MTRAVAAARLGPGLSAGYASGSLVTGAFSTVPGLLLLPYLTDTLGVAAGLAGVLAFLPKAWNVLVNPLAGRVSDCTTSRIGPRRPYVLGAGIVVGVAFAVMFAGPFAAAAGAAWAVAGYFLTATAFAFFQSPYAAMPAEIADDSRERTRLMSWRVAGIALATLATGAVAPLVVRLGGGGLDGYRVMGLLIGAVIVLGAVLAFVGTSRAPRRAAPAREPSLRAQLGVAITNPGFRRLLVIVTTQSAATGAMLAGAAYLARHVLADAATTSALVVAFTVPALVVLPLLGRYGPGLDKRAGVLASSAVFVVASLGWLVLPGGSLTVVLGLALVIGAANAVQDTFVLAILADRIAEDTMRTGRRQGGVFAGLFSAGQGLGFAVGPLLFGLVLQLAGYIPSTTGEAAAQSTATTNAVLLGFAVLPATLTAVSLLALRGPQTRGGRPGRTNRPWPAVAAALLLALTACASRNPDPEVSVPNPAPLTGPSIVAVAGTTLHVEQHGAGRPLLLVHGAGEDAAMLATQARSLADAGYHVITYDRRGTGGSGREAWPGNGADQHADDAAALLDALGAAPATVLGVSSGGVVALALAARHPETVTRVVAWEPPASGVLPDAAATNAAVMAPIEAHLREHPGDYVGAQALLLTEILGFPVAVDDPAFATARANAEPMIRDDPSITLRPFRAGELRSVPVTIAVGTEANPVVAGAVAALGELIGRPAVLIDGADHEVYLSNPAVLTELVGPPRTR